MFAWMHSYILPPPAANHSSKQFPYHHHKRTSVLELLVQPNHVIQVRNAFLARAPQSLLQRVPVRLDHLGAWKWENEKRGVCVPV